MIVQKNKEKTIKRFINGNFDEIEVIIPNISDYVMNYADDDLKLDKLIEETLKIKTHEEGISPTLFIYSKYHLKVLTI